MREFRFYCPTEIIAGRGRISELPDRLAALGARRVFLLHDAAVPPVERFCPPLTTQAHFTVIEKQAPRGEPTLDTLAEIVDAVRDAHCDAVVAVGGGSVLDTAKVAAMAAANPGVPYRTFFLGKVPANASVLLVTVPTTAGTGAEVTRGVAVVNPFTGIKIGFAGGGYYPRIAFLDPALTDSLPFAIAASSGLDAFCQALEAYISPRAFPTTDCLSLEAIRLIATNFDAACRDGRADARDAMLTAATFSALAFSTGSGLTFSHHFSDIAGPRLGLSHGHAASLLLGAVTRQAARTQPSRFPALAHALGCHVHEVPSKVADLVRSAEAPRLDMLISFDEATDLVRQSLAQADERAPFTSEQALEAVRLAFEP